MSANVETVAEHYLAALRARGIERLFFNAGTDFAPLVEAYARNHDTNAPPFPEPILATHENLAIGMAHGAYLVTGKPQAVMVHVSVGTANTICGLMNAARDRIPILLTAGRSPILEADALGARDLRIHWGQEMFDQAGMVRELVKWDYELRDARQVDDVVDRAVGHRDCGTERTDLSDAAARGARVAGVPHATPDAVDGSVAAGTGSRRRGRTACRSFCDSGDAGDRCDRERRRSRTRSRRWSRCASDTASATPKSRRAT